MMQEQLLKQCVKFSANLDSQRIFTVIEVEISYPTNSHKFLNTLGIDLTFCSAYHHSSNPAECAIRNVKNLMKHCASAGKSWHIALLEYLAAPLGTGIPSPAAMMGRDFRGLLPHLQHFLPDNTKEQLVHHHEKPSSPWWS